MPAAIPVSSSLPQGDALSPLCLVAILAVVEQNVATEVQAATGTQMQQVTFNLIAKGAQMARSCVDAWATISAQVGLKENPNKFKICPGNNVTHSSLQGFALEQIVQTVRILGVDFTSNPRSADRPVAAQRLQEATALVRRIGSLPHGVFCRSRLISSLALSKACWGIWSFNSTAKFFTELEQSMKVALFRNNTTVTSPLRALLEGHSLDPRFRVGVQAFSFFDHLIRAGDICW